MSEVLNIEIRSTHIVALSLIGWAVVLWAADRYEARLSVPRATTTWQDALLIGIAQILALVPGTSRSGITMTAGLFRGFSKKHAAEFSFLMSIPVIALAGGLKVLQFFIHGDSSITAGPLAVGFLASALSGYIAIWGLLKIIQKWSFTPFVVYRILVGIAILVLLT